MLGKTIFPCLGDKISGKYHCFSKIILASLVTKFYFHIWFKLFLIQLKLKLDLEACSEKDRNGRDDTHQLHHLIPYISNIFKWYD